MTNQQIKAGDYVYIPHYSRKALLVQSDHTKMMYVHIDNIIQPHIDKNGFNSVHNIEPIAFLATPANKAKIEQFYGCELESPTTRMATLTIQHDNS